MKKASFKTRISLLLILTLLVAAVTVGCSEETTHEGEYSFDFIATFADGTEKAFEVSTTCETVGEALITEGLIEGEDGPFGLYVKRVCGVVADYNIDQTYWALYIDGEVSMVGADSVKCADVSLVEFKVEK